MLEHMENICQRSNLGKELVIFGLDDKGRGGYNIDIHIYLSLYFSFDPLVLGDLSYNLFLLGFQDNDTLMFVRFLRAPSRVRGGGCSG